MSPADGLPAASDPSPTGKPVPEGSSAAVVGSTPGGTKGTPPPGPDPVAAGADTVPPPPPPTLEEDLAALEAMNWFQASVIRIRKGAHPDPAVEALLARRFDLPRHRFLGPWPVRYLSTFAWIFTCLTAAWIGLWALGTALAFTEGIWLASGLMTTAMAALFGLALSQPIVFVDERALEEAGKAELARLRSVAGLARDAGVASGAGGSPAAGSASGASGAGPSGPAGPVGSAGRKG